MSSIDRRRHLCVAALALGALLLSACDQKPAPAVTPPATNAATAPRASASGVVAPAPNPSGSGLPRQPAPEKPPPPPEPTSLCDAPFPSRGQRYHELLKTHTVFESADAGVSPDFSGQTRDDEDLLVLQTLVVNENVAELVLKSHRVVDWSSERIDGKESGYLVPTGLGDGPRKAREHPSRAALDATGKSLAKRIWIGPGETSLRLTAPTTAKLPWGDALLYQVRASAVQAELSAGRQTTETFALSGTLTLRAEDGAFVSLVLKGKDALVDHWREGNRTDPPVHGEHTLELTRPCFQTAVHPAAGKPRMGPR